MSADKLSRIGRALYGERWKTSLALELNVSDRTIRRWLTGEFLIPDQVEIEARKLLVQRLREIGGIVGYTVNTAQSGVFHNPTCAFFYYDTADKLTFVNPWIVSASNMYLVVAGAEEAIKRERRSGVTFNWVILDGN